MIFLLKNVIHITYKIWMKAKRLHTAVFLSIIWRGCEKCFFKGCLETRPGNRNFNTFSQL